jgi:hypothetical protein
MDHQARSRAGRPSRSEMLGAADPSHRPRQRRLNLTLPNSPARHRTSGGSVHRRLSAAAKSARLASAVPRQISALRYRSPSIKPPADVDDGQLMALIPSTTRREQAHGGYAVSGRLLVDHPVVDAVLAAAGVHTRHVSTRLHGWRVPRRSEARRSDDRAHHYRVHNAGPVRAPCDQSRSAQTAQRGLGSRPVALRRSGASAPPFARPP